MCLPIDDAGMTCWLSSQLKVLDAWREELVLRPELEIAQVEALQRHRDWLASELERLETAQAT